MTSEDRAAIRQRLERWQERANDLRRDAASWREASDMTSGHAAVSLVRDALENERIAAEWEEAAEDGLRLLAALDQRDAELKRWQTCENCGEPLAGPGICSKAISEREKGLEQMLDETLTRAEKADADLAACRAENARLREALLEHGQCFNCGTCYSNPYSEHMVNRWLDDARAFEAGELLQEWPENQRRYPFNAKGQCFMCQPIRDALAASRPAAEGEEQ